MKSGRNNTAPQQGQWSVEGVVDGGVPPRGGERIHVTGAHQIQRRQKRQRGTGRCGWGSGRIKRGHVTSAAGWAAVPCREEDVVKMIVRHLDAGAKWKSRVKKIDRAGFCKTQRYTRLCNHQKIDERDNQEIDSPVLLVLYLT